MHGRNMQFRGIDFDRLQNAVCRQSQPRFIAMCLDHEQQGLPEVVAALIQRPAMGDGSGDFLNPPHKLTVGFGLDDGVVTLPHG